MVKTNQIILGVSIICYLIGIILIMKYDPFGNNPAAKAMSISLSVFGFFIIGFFIYLMQQFAGTDGDSTNPVAQIAWNFIIMLLIIGIIFTLSIVFVQALEPSASSTGTTAFFINVFLIIGITAFLINLIRGNKRLHDDNTIWSLIKNVLLYLPCLFINVIEYLKYQYNITTKTHWIILAIDIGLILAKDYLPKIKSFFLDVGGKQILNDPIYLNKKNFIANYNDLVPQPKVKDDHLSKLKQKYEYNYAVSMWIYINPQPPNTNSSYSKYTPLFNFGDKPLISYKGANNTVKITMKNGKKNKIEIYKGKNLKLQKWNNFVINYNGGTLDIFLNNELIASKPGIVPYMKFDTMETGSIGGIHGGICNVKYFNKALKKNMIDSIYKSAYDKTPPVV